MKKSNLSHLYLKDFTVRYSGLLGFCLAIALLSGCGTKQLNTTGGAAGDALPKPGATVEVGTITVDVEKHFDLNPSLFLNEALVSALKKEQLLWNGDKSSPRFLFNARIVDYEPGNAFKRWILPGWGSTVLEIRGEIIKPDDGGVAAVIENKRSVLAGGGYTIGAWKNIFGDVATDLVREMKTRINGGGFLVNLAPYSEQASEVAQTKNPLEIEVRNIRDMRVDKLRLGERTAAFGVKMGDIYPNRRASEYLTETLSDALRTMGHKVGPSANGVMIEGELLKFSVETPATMLYWDITAEIELKLLIKGSRQDSGGTRLYTSKKQERTYVWPSDSLIEKAVSACVADVVSQIQSDAIWSKIVTDVKH
jgi:hypothetical protein